MPGRARVCGPRDQPRGFHRSTGPDSWDWVPEGSYGCSSRSDFAGKRLVAAVEIVAAGQGSWACHPADHAGRGTEAGVLGSLTCREDPLVGQRATWALGRVHSSETVAGHHRGSSVGVQEVHQAL